MSGEGNPNHDPSTGQFSSGGGSSGGGVGKTPRKVRTARRSAQPIGGKAGTPRPASNAIGNSFATPAGTKEAQAKVATQSREFSDALHNYSKPDNSPPAPSAPISRAEINAQAKALGRKENQKIQAARALQRGSGGVDANPPANSGRKASMSNDDLQKLINPGYGVKSYAPIPGGLKDPKPIDPAHVPGGGRAARTAARSKDPFAPDKHAQATSARLAQGISKKTPTMNVLNPERAAGGGGKVSFKNLNATTLEKHNLNVPLSSDQEQDLRSHYNNFTKVSDKYSKEAIRHHNGNDITATHLKGANGDKYVVMTSGRNGKVYGIEHRDAAGNETYRVNTDVFGDVEDTERMPTPKPGQRR